MKIVINDYFGGYGLSEGFLEKHGEEFEELERNDPRLVAAIEEFGEEESSDDATDYLPPRRLVYFC